METLTINTKGQVTIPAKIRKEMDLKPGAQLRVFHQDDALVMSPAVSIADGFGILPQPSRAYSIEEINSAIAQEAAAAGTGNLGS